MVCRNLALLMLAIGLSQCGGEVDPSRDPTAPGTGNIVSVYAGFGRSCAIDLDGKLRCWGASAASTEVRIGDDEPASRAVAVKAGGKVIQVTDGSHHACLLLDSGRVRCWGALINGNLGIGHDLDSGELPTWGPEFDVDVGGTVVQLAASAQKTCVLLATGSVRCWGENRSVPLGYPRTDDVGDDETPASAGDISIGGKVTQIAVASSHNCALLDSGNVRCWGLGAHGALGYPGLGELGRDVSVAAVGDVPIGEPVKQVVAGDEFTCVVSKNGKVYCWGNGEWGRTGHGNSDDTGDNETPAMIAPVSIGGEVLQLSAGMVHVCALLAGGLVRCWGFGDTGTLGTASEQDIGDDERPSQGSVVPLGAPAVQISSGAGHSCALLESGVVRCWGWGPLGQLGYGNTENIGDNETPAEVGDVPLE